MDGLYKEFGRLLKKARKDADLTQQQVAERVGLSRTSITNIERGKQHIALHQLFLLASAIGRSPADLLPELPGSLEDLLPEGAMEDLMENEEHREFVVRMMRKSVAVRSAREGTPVAG